MEATARKIRCLEQGTLRPYTVRKVYRPTGKALDSQGRRYDLTKVYL